MTLKEVQEVANIANKILVINEMIKQIEEEKIDPWNPVSIVVDAVGKYNLQEALFHYLGELKRELKEDITLL